MNSHGISVDPRHIMLLSDIMTRKGNVLGIQRFGIAQMRESTLSKASFERTCDILFDAAHHGKRDSIVGVSECVILGIPMPVGTGLFSLIQKVEKLALPQPKPTLLSSIPKRINLGQ